MDTPPFHTSISEAKSDLNFFTASLGELSVLDCNFWMMFGHHSEFYSGFARKLFLEEHLPWELQPMYTGCNHLNHLISQIKFF